MTRSSGLAEMDPQFVEHSSKDGRGVLYMNCPVCPASVKHRLNIPVIKGNSPRNTGIRRWGMAGTPPDWKTVTLNPSVHWEAPCRAHFSVVNGDITLA